MVVGGGGGGGGGNGIRKVDGRAFKHLIPSDQLIPFPYTYLGLSLTYSRIKCRL